MNHNINDQTSVDIENETSVIGIVPSNNFLGLLPLPYSFAALKRGLPLFQTSSSFVDTCIPPTLTNNKNNTTCTSCTHLPLFVDSSKVKKQSNPMSSSTYRSASYAMTKPPLYNQTREKERFELSTLNDKFADYVEKVRYLEAQNKKVQMDTNVLTEKEQDSCQKIKSKFETEIFQLRQAAEKLFKDKNSTFSAAQQTQSTILPLKQRLNQTFRECDATKYDTEKLERQLSSTDGDIMMYQRRLVHQNNQHTQWKQLIAHMQRLLVQTRNETHTETLTRTSCEQKTKQLQDEIARLREQQQQNLNDVKQSALMSGSNSTNDRAHVFKSELSSAIKRIRQDFEHEHETHRNELYTQFTQSYENIARQYPELGHLFLNEREQERVKHEEDRVRLDIQRVRTDITALKQKTSELKLHVRELQIKIEMITDENQRIEQAQLNQINHFKTHHEKATDDYEDVINKQSTLEKEIETYRNLLEGTMKPVVDNITDEYNSIAANQVKVEQQTHETNRKPYTAHTDRLSTHAHHTKTSNSNFYDSSKSLYTNNKPSGRLSTTIIDIPITRIVKDTKFNTNMDDTNARIDDNEQHIVEIDETTNDSSSPHT